MAKRHVDGNNIGPSYIQSIGPHVGGELWTADKYVTSTDTVDGVGVMRGGGGEGVLNCHNNWMLFNGNAEHETMCALLLSAPLCPPPPPPSCSFPSLLPRVY